ncbi:MAG: plastid ribosomal protein S21 [Monoraphidium minutum]|nr:MAG: plastid ribosomal protein S21 [Monoraphidium minutum]
MASLTCARALAGRPFAAATSSRPRRGPAPPLARRDSFMVEVEIAEDEPEDVAVRRYMKAVMQSGVIPKLRALRRKESKIETYKRKLQERAQARRLGILEPTWDEFYGENSLFDNGTAPFDDFFKSPDDDFDVFDNNSMPILDALDSTAYDTGSWGYQGGYQPNAYGAAQQPPAPGGAPGAAQGDTFDLSAYEQQQQQPPAPNGFQY